MQYISQNFCGFILKIAVMKCIVVLDLVLCFAACISEWL